MKAMKYVGLATLAAVTLGFATPAFAADGGDIENEGKNGYTDVEVNVTNGTEFKLVSVPESIPFTTPLSTTGHTAITATDFSEEIEVYRGYTIENNHVDVPINVTIGDLTVKRGADTVGTIPVTSFEMAETTLAGSGESATLFNDSDFGGATDTANIAKAITSAKLGFGTEVTTSNGTAQLQVNDTLTGQITYTIGNASTGE